MSNQRIKASDVTEHLRERIRSAEEIWLVDPHQGTGPDNRHAWMELIVSVPPPVPEVVDPSAPQLDPSILEIEVDSTDLTGLVEIRERIRRMCGQPEIEPPHGTGAGAGAV
jgi:hypothetical protein